VANTFFNSHGCAPDCRSSSNTPGDAFDRTGACLADDWESMNIFADPLFCDPAHDDYHVRSDSPAITGGRQIGAFLTPGCQAP